MCEAQQVTSTSGKQMNWNSCLCEPCPAGSVQFRQGRQVCVQCPPGWYQPFLGRTECLQCPAGSFNPKIGRSATCQLCPPGTYSFSEVGRCRLTASKPELKARLVSAISA